MKEFLLLLIAIVLFVVLGTIGFVFEMIVHLFCLNEYLYKLAICIDKTGNVVCGSLFNLILKTKDGYNFGDHRNTISFAIGINKEKGTLTPLGLNVYRLLNRIEKNHVENAAKNNT